MLTTGTINGLALVPVIGAIGIWLAACIVAARKPHPTIELGACQRCGVQVVELPDGDLVHADLVNGYMMRSDHRPLPVAHHHSPENARGVNLKTLTGEHHNG